MARRSGREKFDRLAMARPQKTDVPAIQGGQLGLVESLDDGKDRRVDEPDVRIRGASAELPDPRVVRCFKVRYDPRPRFDIAEQGDLRPGWKR